MNLPNEIIEYILSIAIWYKFYEFYSNVWDSLKLPFLMKLEDSPMSRYMMKLSTVHPDFKKFLKNQCVFFDERWSFKKKFFFNMQLFE